MTTTRRPVRPDMTEREQRCYEILLERKGYVVLDKGGKSRAIEVRT